MLDVAPFNEDRLENSAIMCVFMLHHLLHLQAFPCVCSGHLLIVKKQLNEGRLLTALNVTVYQRSLVSISHY